MWSSWSKTKYKVYIIPNGAGWPAAASKPHDTKITSG